MAFTWAGYSAAAVRARAWQKQRISKRFFFEKKKRKLLIIKDLLL
jgi:hypothetical protein